MKCRCHEKRTEQPGFGIWTGTNEIDQRNQRAVTIENETDLSWWFFASGKSLRRSLAFIERGAVRGSRRPQWPLLIWPLQQVGNYRRLTCRPQLPGEQIPLGGSTGGIGPHLLAITFPTLIRPSASSPFGRLRAVSNQSVAFDT
jgi:hypothetical protein